MLSVDPPDHTRLRRLVSAAFSPRRVEGLRPRVQAIVDDLLDGDRRRAARRRRRPRHDLRLPAAVHRHLRAARRARADRGSAGSPALTALLVPTLDARRSTRGRSGVRRRRRDARSARRRRSSATPGDDLVSALISARDGDERLSTQELLSTIFQLIVAGHDTTASLIGNSVVALLRTSRAARPRCAPIPARLAAAIEELPPLRRAGPPLDLPLRRRSRWRSAG